MSKSTDRDNTQEEAYQCSLAQRQAVMEMIAAALDVRTR